jgi:pyruvate formate lyase activating enzyme
MQADFVAEFLSLCRSRCLHTAIETAAYTSWEKLSSLLSQLDLMYVDLKHMDEQTHREWTGVSNRPILKNIKCAADVSPLILRVPVVPSFNDSAGNIAETAEFAKALGPNLLRVELLPYHRYGAQKYEELDRDYELQSLEPPSKEHLNHLRSIVQAAGINCEIGG